MTIADLQSICKKLPGVTQDIKWENHLCFNIGEKMFLVTSPDSVPVTASFKVSDVDFEELSNKEGFKPAAYLARYKWIFVEDINYMNKKEWIATINQSYKLIASKLPAKTKKLLKLDHSNLNL
jgi:predicted DNA-binding protein (MmcQ/YjbR family)